MPWNCDSCHTHVTNDLICTRCGSSAAGADPRLVGIALQRDRIMEGHLTALALWYRIFAVLGVVGAVALFAGGVRLVERFGRDDDSGSPLAAVAVVMLLASATSYLLGHFVARYANWARITAGVFAVLGLVLQIINFAATAFALYASPYQLGGAVIPVLLPVVLGLVWAVSVTWAFLSPRAAHVCTEPYRQMVAQTSTLRPPTFRSFFFMAPLVGVAVGVGLLALPLLARL